MCLIQSFESVYHRANEINFQAGILPYIYFPATQTDVCWHIGTLCAARKSSKYEISVNNYDGVVVSFAFQLTIDIASLSCGDTQTTHIPNATIRLIIQYFFYGIYKWKQQVIDTDLVMPKNVSKFKMRSQAAMG